MKLSSTFTFTMSLVGNTGYNNQSQLTLIVFNLGTLTLGHKTWDLTHCDLTKYSIKSLTLIIPSGKLIIYEPMLIVSGNQLAFIGQGDWDGIHRGLSFGASGYGDFTFNKETATVSNSVFNIPADVKCGFFGASQREVDIAIAHPLGWCTYSEFVNRVEAMDNKYGYEQVRELASKIHLILNTEEKDGFAVIVLKTWISDIETAVA